MICEKEKYDDNMNSLPMVFMKVIGKMSLALKNWLITLPTALYITVFVDTIFKNVEYQDVLLPLILGILTLIVYFIVAFFDFLTGMRASAHTSETITSKRLWRTLFKIGTVCLINFSLSIFASIFVITGITYLATPITILIPGIMLSVVLFELHSIGENYEIFMGKKPEYFKIIDRMASTLEEGIMNKIKNFFK